MRRIPARLALALAAALAAGAGEADPLAALPALPRPTAQVADRPPFDPTAGVVLDPAVRFVAGTRVVLDGAIQVDKGPVDGLEVLACLREGKTHEALVRLGVASGAVVKAAALAAFAPPDGRPAEENRGIPARGTPVRLTLMWKDEDGAWRWLDAATLVRDRATDRAYPPLPWVWTGSRIQIVTEAMPDGAMVRRERFMLDVTRSIAVNYDEPDALLASPFPPADQDQRFEVNSSVAPPPRTPVHLALTLAETVLDLHLAATGTLSSSGVALDDAALGAALAKAFGAGAAPPHRAVFVRLPAALPDEAVVAARARILAVAAAAQAWTVPLFIPE